MPTHNIIVGRTLSDIAKYGEAGTIYLGKHLVGTGEQAHLTNKILMDMIRPHVGLVVGKRGEGKSYDLAVMAEEMITMDPEIRKNLAIVMIDTMGIFWSMKNPNDREIEQLTKWQLKPESFDVKVAIPIGFKSYFDESNVPYDSTISIKPSDLTIEDWSLTFQISLISPVGIILDRILENLRDKDYTLDDMTDEVRKVEYSDSVAKEGLINLLDAAKRWGIFSQKGESLESVIKPGEVTILDVSMLTDVEGGWSVKTLLVGLLSRSMYMKRVAARREEEIRIIGGEDIERQEPITWLMIDEAHQFLPADTKTSATDALLTLVKQGRQPGISCIFATQQPNKLHPDAISQADIVISHRLTAKNDVESLRNIMQTYLLFDLQKYISDLPKEKGVAIVLDDNSERIYMMKVRPRKSWHAGETPVAIEAKKEF